MSLLARIAKLDATRRARAARMQRYLSPVTRAARWAAMLARRDPSVPQSTDQRRCARAAELYRLASNRRAYGDLA